MKTSAPDFMEIWGDYVVQFSYACFGLALLIIIIHEIRIMAMPNYKSRYDYVNQHEIRFFWYAIIALIAGASLWLTAIISPLVDVDSFLKPIVDLFFLAGFVVVSYYFLASLLRILYPRFLENRLLRIRNKLRVSSAGNYMRKLSHEEGRVHLEADGFTDMSNAVHSIEYDVWIDEKTGEKKIEKYFIYQHAEKCEECGYQTMMIASEEITKEPSSQEPGVLVKHYCCTYCNHREAKQVVIAPISTNLAGAF